ncbi:MAG: 2-amino-4-hydroxy-6-hydroxymethyldihydropteridine diphosphokinase [Elusimicrobia bacterium]|nr:2-amino-4-hydroxy-6-hydroxymethyldihydropteridine diphosphokinase [Elusimicrobiota bacterium]
MRNPRKRGWRPVYLSLGSNMGRRSFHLQKAKDWLSEHPQIKIRKESSVYETSPVGPPQKPFLNSVLSIQTSLSPSELLAYLQWVESKMKRKKSARWGPRVIDLDIILYGNVKIQTASLTIPHPEFHKRRFVLAPLSEIEHGLKPAGFRKTVARILSELTDSTQRVTLFPLRP